MKIYIYLWWFSRIYQNHSLKKAPFDLQNFVLLTMKNTLSRTLLIPSHFKSRCNYKWSQRSSPSLNISLPLKLIDANDQYLNDAKQWTMGSHMTSKKCQKQNPLSSVHMYHKAPHNQSSLWWKTFHGLSLISSSTVKQIMEEFLKLATVVLPTFSSNNNKSTNDDDDDNNNKASTIYEHLL